MNSKIHFIWNNGDYFIVGWWRWHSSWRTEPGGLKYGRNGLLASTQQSSTHEHGNQYDGQPTDATNVCFQLIVVCPDFLSYVMA